MTLKGIEISGTTFMVEDTQAVHVNDGYATEAFVSAFTYDKQTIDDKVASGGTFVPTLYYQKSETSSKTEIDDAMAEKLAVSDFQTYSGVVASELSGKASQSLVDTLSGQIQTISSSTSGDVTIISGDIVTISGDVITISGNVETISEDVESISGDVVSLSNDFTAHTSNTEIHVTSAQTATWDAKPNVVMCTEAEWATISGSTVNGYIYLVY